MEEDPSPPPPQHPLDRAFLTDVPGLTTVLLVRHGEQEHGDPGDTRSWVDPPLSPRGWRQAEAVGAGLRDEGIDAVYASPLERALETGKAIAGHHGHDVTVVDDLREIEMFRDIPEGRTLFDAVDPVLLRGMGARFARERTWDVYPLTETGAELRRRVVGAIEGIVAGHAGQTVVIACHGGVINSYLGYVIGKTDEDMWFRPNHASVHRVVALGERRVLRSLNETHHLRAVDEELVSW
jgi:broad specificity phosphatase PhoE